MNNAQKPENSESTFFEDFSYKYLPFWPLFIFFLIVLLVGAWVYLRYTTPVYATSSTLLINDEKKGADENKIEESLNLLSSNKIVENEIEVIKSRKLMEEVVKDLHLYAPVYEEGKVKLTSAYASSPVTIEVNQPEKLKYFDKIYFTYNYKNKTVVINKNAYPLDTMVATPYGNIKFTVNKYFWKPTEKPLYFALFQPKQIANAILGNLYVSATSKQSSIVYLYLKDEVPQRGEDILNVLMDKYNNDAIEYKNNLAKNTIAFVDERLRLVSDELNSVEKKIQDFKTRKGIVDLSEQGKLYLRNVSESDQKLADVNTRLGVLNQVENYVTAKDNSTGIVPATLGINDPVLTKLLDKLYQAEIDIEKLKKTTAANNPILESITNEREKIRPSILENIRNQKANLEVSKNDLSTTTRSFNSALQSIPQQERELLNVSREQLIKNNVYSFLLQKREETALAYASNLANSKIISPAQSTNTPVTPKTNIIYLVAVVLAFVLSIALVSFKELFTGKILFRTQIEKYTNIPIVGEISNFKEKKGILVKGNENRAIQEQFRQLRAATGLFNKTNIKKKILVTSSIPGEGKSLISTNLALSLSRSGKKVILIDMDIRNPEISKNFQVSKNIGIANFLEENIEPAEIINNSNFHNLFILPAGETKENPTELLLNGKLSDLFDYLEAGYDYIIIDTPPVNSVTDAFILSEFCDFSLYVIRHKYTPKTFIKKLDDNIKMKPLKNIAIVFNGIKPRGFIKGDYGYGYGYGYESKSKEKYLIQNNS
ncbi:MAG: polysaccharide biosynthesis tyrosine autokinase [Chitinophagaceae bacterium]|nr:polysaccharide biosynthesis tyrosine autokinase [Chitinophagaceae bacterium]